MIVGEPTLMGGEFGEKDERLIARLENVQFDPNDQDSNIDNIEPQRNRVLACSSGSVSYTSENQNIQQLRQRSRPCSSSLTAHEQWNQEKSVHQQTAKGTNGEKLSGSKVD